MNLKEGTLQVAKDWSLSPFPWHMMGLNPVCWSNSGTPSTAWTIASSAPSPAVLLLLIPGCLALPNAPLMAPLRQPCCPAVYFFLYIFFLSFGINQAAIQPGNVKQNTTLVLWSSEPNFQKEMHFFLSKNTWIKSSFFFFFFPILIFFCQHWWRWMNWYFTHKYTHVLKPQKSVENMIS